MNYNGKRSILLAGLALPLATLTGNSIAWYLKTYNPDNVDVSAGLAYLRPVLLSGVSVFAVCIIGGIIYGLRGIKRDTDRQLAAAGLLLVALIVLVSLGSAVASVGAGRAADNSLKIQSSQTSAR